jgi:hypothetical protein
MGMVGDRTPNGQRDSSVFQVLPNQAEVGFAMRIPMMANSRADQIGARKKPVETGDRRNR